MKRCSHCKQEKENTEFYANKSSIDGLFQWCKDCTKDYMKARNTRITRSKTVIETNPISELEQAYLQSDEYRVGFGNFLQSEAGKEAWKNSMKKDF